MKSIQVPIDENLLRAIDQSVKKGFPSRSDFIRKACLFFLRHIEDLEKEKTYVEGYRRIPEKTDIAEGSARTAGFVLPPEEW